MFGGRPGQRADDEKHIEELKKAIEHDKEVATSPRTNTEPIVAGRDRRGHRHGAV